MTEAVRMTGSHSPVPLRAEAEGARTDIGLPFQLLIFSWDCSDRVVDCLQVARRPQNGWRWLQISASAVVLRDMSVANKTSSGKKIPVVSNWPRCHLPISVVSCGSVEQVREM